MSTSTEAWEALHRAQITLTRRIRQQPEFKSVTFGEFDVLHVLSRIGSEGMRLKHLNEYVPLTQSSLSRMLDRLDGRGYIQKWQDPDDGRGLLICLTEHGRHVHGNIAVRHDEHVSDLMAAALTPDEIDTLTRLATKLHTQS